MKKLLSFLPIFIIIIFAACNDSTKTETKESSEQQKVADSLEDEVWDGHDVGMAKYGKLRSMKLRAEQMLDSISKLPAQAQEAAAPLKGKLDTLVADLAAAKDGMDKWMRDFKRDSAVNDLEQRIKYLMDERLKVGKVKTAILDGLARADSLLR